MIRAVASTIKIHINTIKWLIEFDMIECSIERQLILVH
jgi:hypothetical protein